MDAVLRFIKHYKPHRLIQLGDFCDWDSVTSYDPRREQDIVCIEDEIKASNLLLDSIDAVLPKFCERVILGGNHEERFTKFKTKHGAEIGMRRMRKLTSWWQEYRLPERGWSWCEYGQWREYGKIVYSHGWFSGQNVSKKHLALFHKCMLTGHSHTFDVATGLGLDGKPVLAATIGTLSRFDLSYLVGKPPQNWIHMIAVIEGHTEELFTPHFIPIVDGKFSYGGKVFSS